MNMKSILKVMVITLLCSLTAFSPCYAARIYNDTPDNMYVSGRTFGGLGLQVVEANKVTVSAKTRSDSLNWGGVGRVVVKAQDNNGPEICTVDFGLSHQIVGGNYMVISGEIPLVANKCVVCDSNHKILAGDGHC